MEEKILPLNIPPGFYRDGTTYQAKGRWVDGNLVRFFQGTTRPVGGWQRVQAAAGGDLAAVSGMPRAAVAWRSASGAQWIAIGTVTKLYILAGGQLFDVTPAGFSTSGRVDSTTSSGEYGDGEYGVGLYGTGSVAGDLVDADTWALDVFGEWLVAVNTVDDTLYVWKGNTAVVAAVPSLDITFTGSLVVDGATLAGATSISLKATTLTGSVVPGQTFIVDGTTYTVLAPAVASGNVLSISSIFPAVPSNIANGDPVTGVSSQAVSATAVVTTPERFLVLLGAAGDARQVWWASQETINAFQPLSNNSAGSFILTTNGRLMCGRRTKSETLLWTDADLWRMTFIGDPLDYAFTQAGDQCGIISRLAHAALDATVYWMGKGGFFAYDGYVHPLPCDVSDFVFGNLNVTQRAKVWAVANPDFGEITWYYPSATSTEIDSYVTFNAREGHWVTGSLVRTAGASMAPLVEPILVDSIGQVWQHETGTNHQGATPFLLSGPIEVGPGDLQGYGRTGQGEQIIKLQRFIPDQRALGDLQLTVLSAMFPTDTPTSNGPYPATAPTSLRVTGRQMQLRFDQVNENDWRLGAFRIGVRLGGKR